MRIDLSEKVALVTGSGRGIGKVIATALARASASVIVDDIDLDTADITANEIKTLGGKALPFKADVSIGEVNELVNNSLRARSHYLPGHIQPPQASSESRKPHAISGSGRRKADLEHPSKSPLNRSSQEEDRRQTALENNNKNGSSTLKQTIHTTLHNHTLHINYGESKCLFQVKKDVKA